MSQKDLEEQQRELQIKLAMHAVSMRSTATYKRRPKKEEIKKTVESIVQNNSKPFEEKPRQEITSSEELTKRILEEANAKTPRKNTGTTKYELTPKALEMAEKMASNRGIQDMVKNPIMGSSVRPNPARGIEQTQQSSQTNQQNQPTEPGQEKTKKSKNKDPDYTSISAGAIKPLRSRDSIADILGKMYNLMVWNWESNKKNDKKETKYRKKLVKNKEKNIEELIALFGGRYKKRKYSESGKQKSSFLGGLLGAGLVGVALLLTTKKTFAMFMPSIPDFVKDFLGLETTNTFTGPAASLSELIARGESGGSYDIYNTGTAGITGPPLKLSEMTVGEVMDLQDKKKVIAAGKYQIIPTTLKDAVSKLNIDKNEKFNSNLQERIFSEYLIGSKPGRGAISKYLNSESIPDAKLAYDMQKALAQEFAAVADPDTGKSFHGGVGNNKASISSAEILAAAELDRQKRQFNLANKKKETSPASAVGVITPPIQPLPSNTSTEIPTPISYNKPMNKGTSVAVLNNTTNIIHGGTTYAVDDEKHNSYSSLIEKQYYG